MKKVLTLMILLGSVYLTAQTVRFSYDECGNRTARYVESKGEAEKDFKNKLAITQASENPAKSIRVFPNPCKGPVSILLHNYEEVENKGFIKLYTTNGALLTSREITKSQTEINLEPFEDGVYILKISTAQTQLTEKLIKY